MIFASVWVITDVQCTKGKREALTQTKGFLNTIVINKGNFGRFKKHNYYNYYYKKRWIRSVKKIRQTSASLPTKYSRSLHILLACTPSLELQGTPYSLEYSVLKHVILVRSQET